MTDAPTPLADAQDFVWLAAGRHDGSLPLPDERTRRARFARLADLAARHGASGVDAGTTLPGEPTLARSVLEERGLRLAASWWGLRLLERSVDAELSRIEGHLNLAVGLGTDVLVVAEVTGSVHASGVSWKRRPALHPGARRRLFRGLEVIAAHLQERGVRLAYHHHLGTVVQTASEVESLLDETGGAVGLALDLGQAAAAGIHVASLLTRHRRRVAHIYARDIQPGVLEVANLKQASFGEAVDDGLFSAVGAGRSESSAVLADLGGATAYRGWVVLAVEKGLYRTDSFRRVQRLLRGVSDS